MEHHDPKPDQTFKKESKKGVCPLVRSPEANCFIVNMNSNKISMAVYYCQNHFEQCDIYQKRKGSKEKARGSK